MYCSKCRGDNLKCVETGIHVRSRFDNPSVYHADAFLCRSCGEVTITGVSDSLKKILETELKKWE